MIKTFAVPYLLHGVYNYILFLDRKILWLPFLIFVLFLWYIGLKRMKILLECSPFKNVLHQK
jgi:hypothetical protein